MKTYTIYNQIKYKTQYITNKLRASASRKKLNK